VAEWVNGSTQLGGGLHTAGLVGEQVDVLGGPVDDAVSDQGVATGQSEAVLSGHGEGQACDVSLERV
jgi:hypothetical protein